MIVIMKGDYGHVDFPQPIEMDSEQFKSFKKMLAEIFEESVIEFEELIPEKVREKRIGEYFPKQVWSITEHSILLLPVSTGEKARMLGRSFMSVRMYECKWLPKYYDWTRKNGVEDIFDLNNIERFLKEQDLEKAKKRKVMLLECKKCGTYHDPRNKDWKNCEICGEKLKQIKVTWEERKQLYAKQPKTPEKYKTALNEMMKEYPFLPDDILI